MKSDTEILMAAKTAHPHETPLLALYLYIYVLVGKSEDEGRKEYLLMKAKT
jgi:hypothetical protein